ncbi:2'-5' RNA ligase family protein [Ornithinimicrobium sp. Arc0846-15]|nr:2'-5' RNA ligase family protein [Ornithinimicrobium laminariae]
MPDYALELSFDEASDQAVRDQWAALQNAGLPSQADHKGMTNAPHVTVVAAQDIPDKVIEFAGQAFALPLALTVRGLVLFGEGPRVTIAHLVEPDREVAALVNEIHSRVPANRYPVWTPHITLARRVPRAKVAHALDVLGASDPLGTITATQLRWWDPVQKVVEDVAIAG